MGAWHNIRPFFIKPAGLIAVLLGIPRLLFSADSRQPNPNIVFIVADDLGWTGLGSYGNQLHETPAIDQLAKDGILFTNAYSAATICSPTRASILTGKSPAKLNYTTWREDARRPYIHGNNKLIPPTTIYDLPREEISIARVLQDAGYYTAHVGKWHVGGEGFFPEAHGFDVNIGGSQWGAPESYWAPFRGDNVFTDYRYIPGIDVGMLDSDVYLTDLLTDKALGVIDKAHRHNRPFFLNLWYFTPHTPIEGKPEFVEYFTRKGTPDMRHSNYEYAAMVKSLDENTGRLLDRLDQLGLSDNTIVIFYSDNGGRVGPYGDYDMTADHYPLRSGKGSLYEGGIRVPLIIRWPGVTREGTKSAVPVTSYDFYPTLLDATNLEGCEDHNAEVEGISIVPILKDPSFVPDRDNLFWHYPHYYFPPVATTPKSAVRSNEWKLIQFYEDGSLELYNLKEDIGETTNLVETHPETARELHELLREWRIKVNAQLPRPNPLYKPDDW